MTLAEGITLGLALATAFMAYATYRIAKVTELEYRASRTPKLRTEWVADGPHYQDNSDIPIIIAYLQSEGPLSYISDISAILTAEGSQYSLKTIIPTPFGHNSIMSPSATGKVKLMFELSRQATGYCKTGKDFKIRLLIETCVPGVPEITNKWEVETPFKGSGQDGSLQFQTQEVSFLRQYKKKRGYHALIEVFRD